MSNAELIAKLRAAGSGFNEWRVQSPVDGSYCISFTRDEVANPEREAREWLAREMRERPDGLHSGFVVALNRVQTPKDKALDEAADALQRLEAQREQWAAVVWAVARELDCLPSTYSDGNGHVLKAAIKHMADARRYRDVRDGKAGNWAICEWGQENDHGEYYRDGRAPAIVDAAVDAARLSNPSAA